MTTRTKVITAAVVILFAALAISNIVSYIRIRSGEIRIGELKNASSQAERTATETEARSEQYRLKAEYLEAELAAIGQIARRQNEEIEKMGSDIGIARRDVNSAKSIRSIATTAYELCRKLSELGHPCDGEDSSSVLGSSR